MVPGSTLIIFGKSILRREIILTSNGTDENGGQVDAFRAYEGCLNRMLGGSCKDDAPYFSGRSNEDNAGA